MNLDDINENTRSSTPPPLVNVEVPSTPPHLKQLAAEITSNLLPSKSKAAYEKAYENFLLWKKEQHVTFWSEDTLLSYFGTLNLKYKPSTL